jgi:hypothetical protein
MVVFIAILGLALVYEWRSGALDWGNKTRVGLKNALKSTEVK